jgi:hypothetical protein
LMSPLNLHTFLIPPSFTLSSMSDIIFVSAYS